MDGEEREGKRGRKRERQGVDREKDERREREREKGEGKREGCRTLCLRYLRLIVKSNYN